MNTISANEITVGEQIKKLRTAKKMTLAVMAERIGVTTSTIASYENGSRKPSLDILVKIAGLFRVSTDNLLGYSNKFVVDVSELTYKQRVTIHEIVNTYRAYNSMYKHVLTSDLIRKELEAQGFSEKLNEWHEINDE